MILSSSLERNSFEYLIFSDSKFCFESPTPPKKFFRGPWKQNLKRKNFLEIIKNFGQKKLFGVAIGNFKEKNFLEVTPNFD